MSDVNWVALIVLAVLFVMVAVMGFWASRWRRPDSMESLDEISLVRFAIKAQAYGTAAAAAAAAAATPARKGE